MYRSIDAKFWTDPKIRELAPAQKLLFLYLITNSHSHVSGIYYLPKVLIQHETGLTPRDVDNGIDTLSIPYLCLYDTQTEVVWVTHMLRYQHHGEKIRLAVASQLESLHKCPLIKAFLEEYADINIPYRYPIDTRAPVSKEQEQEQDLEQEQNKRKLASASQRKARPTKFLPEDFVITDVHRAWAAREVPTIDIEYETAKLREHEYREPHTDWNRAWRGWMLKAVELQQSNHRHPQSEAHTKARWERMKQKLTEPVEN